MTNKQLHETHKLGNEENKCEDKESEEGVTKNFSNDVAVQDAHGMHGECSMGGGVRRQHRFVMRKRKEEVRGLAS